MKIGAYAGHEMRPGPGDRTRALQRHVLVHMHVLLRVYFTTFAGNGALFHTASGFGARVSNGTHRNWQPHRIW